MSHMTRRGREFCLFAGKSDGGNSDRTRLTRRSLLVGGASVGLAAILPRRAEAAMPAIHELRLAAAPGRAALIGGSAPQTDVWAYQGTVPGPEIRVSG